MRGNTGFVQQSSKTIENTENASKAIKQNVVYKENEEQIQDYLNLKSNVNLTVLAGTAVMVAA